MTPYPEARRVSAASWQAEQDAWWAAAVALWQAEHEDRPTEAMIARAIAIPQTRSAACWPGLGEPEGLMSDE